MQKTFLEKCKVLNSLIIYKNNKCYNISKEELHFQQLSNDTIPKLIVLIITFILNQDGCEL